MHWLALLFTGLFTKAFTYFGLQTLKKVAIIIAVSLAVVAMAALLHTALSQIMATIQASTAVPAILAEGIGWLPQNTSVVISLMVTAEAALWVFRWGRRFAEYRLHA